MAFQTDAFQNDAFQTEEEDGVVGTISSTLDSLSVSIAGELSVEGSISAATDSVEASIGMLVGDLSVITIAFRNGANPSIDPDWQYNESLNNIPSGSVYADLIDIYGDATGVSLSSSAAFSGNGSGSAASGAGDWPRDIFEHHTILLGGLSITLTFGGFQPTSPVTIEIAGHRGTNSERDLYFTFGGEPGVWDQSGTSTVTAPTSVTGYTDTSGDIDLVIETITTGEPAYINGMKLFYEGPGTPVTLVDYYLADADHDSARIATRIPEGGNIAIEYSINSDFSSSSSTSTQTANSGNNYTVIIPITGLSAATTYYYRAVRNGFPDVNTHGITPKFKTAPAGAGNIKFALSGCANTGSTANVFGRIMARNPDVFIHHGDFHYEDIATEDLALKRSTYRTVLRSPEQNRLYKSQVLLYRYDDHDYGANNSNSSNPGKVSSAAAVREMFPQERVNSSGAIYYTTKLGRVRVIQVDTRYEKNGTAMLGSTQLTWLLDELTSAAADVAANDIALVIVDVSIPWIATAVTDSWSDATAERTTISDHIWDIGLENNICFVAGDMHGLAFDDGTNNDFDTIGRAGWPVIQSGSLDRTVSSKGGPYTNGPYTDDTGQYTILDLVDDGVKIVATVTGYDINDDEVYTVEFETPTVITGSISSTLAGASADIDGDISVSGSLLTTLANAQPDIDGEVEVPVVTGVISSTMDNAIFDADGEVLVSGIINANMANVAVDIDGVISVTGTIASTLANVRTRIRGLSGEDTGGDAVYEISSRKPEGVSLASSSRTISARKL